MVSDQTIRKAADVISEERELGTVKSRDLAEALADAGLLTPSPITHEEWDVLIDDRYYANLVDKTRDSAEGMVRRGHGKLVHRYATDWEEA